MRYQVVWHPSPDVYSTGYHTVAVAGSGEVVKTYPPVLDCWEWTQYAAAADAAFLNANELCRELIAEREAQHAQRDGHVEAINARL